LSLPQTQDPDETGPGKVDPFRQTKALQNIAASPTETSS